ncbi:tRNA lysidine(34) synthetase TilS [Sphingomicrobium sp. XHP0239]|uniref:tRNA lysidine(34) synthetase TilS n=1 Tax=Sphingomicrobium maritimum TaxID=3133972 RepID=UPI0031CCAC89
MTGALDPTTVERFARDLDALVPAGVPFGVAVSGGADSLALLLMSHAVAPDRVRAATVDHGLRPESSAEAAFVASVCADRDIPHATLTIDWAEGPPTANIEALARDARYERFGRWAAQHHLGYLATGHHADDQAETMLMRLARGAGLSGLAGIRREIVQRDLTIVRPLLRWTRDELRSVVAAAGLDPAEDPHNDDPTFDRARLRTALRAAGFHDASSYAASAVYLQEAEEALGWMLFDLWDRVAVERNGTFRLDLDGIPSELRRRLLRTAIHLSGDRLPRGPELRRAVERVEDLGKTSLGATLIERDGTLWTVRPAPPRRTG